MTVSLAEIRDAIKATITVAVPELTGYDTVPDQVNLPCFIIVPVSAAYAFAKPAPDDEWTFDLHVLVSRGDTGLGQDALDAFVSSGGPKSLREVILRYPNLGIDTREANVRARLLSMSNYGGQFEAAGVDHIGATLRLVVNARGPNVR